MLLVGQSNDNTANLTLAQTCLSSRICNRSEKRIQDALVCLYSHLSSKIAASKSRKKKNQVIILTFYIAISALRSNPVRI